MQQAAVATVAPRNSFPEKHRLADQTMANLLATVVAPPIKPAANPDAYYDYAEAEALGFGKYLKLRRAILSGRLRAYYSGRNVRLKGSDLIAWLEGKSQK